MYFKKTYKFSKFFKLAEMMYAGKFDLNYHKNIVKATMSFCTRTSLRPPCFRLVSLLH